jgi:hypothetical protein
MARWPLPHTQCHPTPPKSPPARRSLPSLHAPLSTPPWPPSPPFFDHFNMGFLCRDARTQNHAPGRDTSPCLHRPQHAIAHHAPPAPTPDHARVASRTASRSRDSVGHPPSRPLVHFALALSCNASSPSHAMLPRPLMQCFLALSCNASFPPTLATPDVREPHARWMPRPICRGCPAQSPWVPRPPTTSTSSVGTGVAPLRPFYS